MENEIDVEKYFKDFSEKFKNIKKSGWIKSIQKGNGGIGRTFENLMGIEENNLEIPDFNGIEIKAKRYNSVSDIKLFCATPTGPHYHEIEVLQTKYGYSVNNNDYKKFNASVTANNLTSSGVFYCFKLIVDREKEKIFLCVYNRNGYLLEKETYWDFDILKEKLERKFQYLALVKALDRNTNDGIFFKYYKTEIYKLKGFEEFINLLENGIIRVQFCVNVFKNGKRKGQTHDNGTSFNISEKNLGKLFTKIQEIY